MCALRHHWGCVFSGWGEFTEHVLELNKPLLERDRQSATQVLLRGRVVMTEQLFNVKKLRQKNASEDQLDN